MNGRQRDTDQHLRARDGHWVNAIVPGVCRGLCWSSHWNDQKDHQRQTRLRHLRLYASTEAGKAAERAAGRHVETVARSVAARISAQIHAKVVEVALMASDDAVQDVVRTSNRQYERLADDVITAKQVGDGDERARGHLVERVYRELRRLAGYYMRGERIDHTLQPTALLLVHCRARR